MVAFFYRWERHAGREERLKVGPELNKGENHHHLCAVLGLAGRICVYAINICMEMWGGCGLNGKGCPIFFCWGVWMIS